MSVRQQVMRFFLDVLYPPRCVGCRERGSWLCQRCLAATPRLPADHCRHCAIPMSRAAVCPDCWRDPPEFEQVSCAFLFEGPIRAAIHQLKYRGARHLAEPMVQAALTELSVPPSDLVVPVPLHPRRLAERGYNQSALLAQALSAITNLPLVDNALQRVKDTPAQVSLPGKERWLNVRGAFHADPGAFAHQSVLLLDDVATTGSTLRAAARAIKRSGARQVDALIMARAVIH